MKSMTLSSVTERLKDLHKVQGAPGNWNYDSYMQGMFNGMELALAILEDREPEFRSKPEEGWIHDNIPADFVPETVAG